MQIPADIEDAYGILENLLWTGMGLMTGFAGAMATLMHAGPQLTGIGIEVTDGSFNPNLELVAYFKSDPGLPQDLRTFLPPPFPNVRVRWRTTGRFRSINGATFPPPAVGLTIAPMRSPFTAGTLGGVAEDSSGQKFIISCNHVIAINENGPTAVIYPGNQAGLSGAATHAIAACTLAPSCKLTAAINWGDFAAAKLNPGIIIQPPQDPAMPKVSIAKPMSPQVFRQTGHTKQLSKLGAKTQVTHGKAIAPQGSFTVDVDLPTAVSLKFGKQYLIRGIGGDFADAGDSGSLVVTSDGEAVGILFAKNDHGEGVVCPIDHYFSDLNLSFPV